MISYKDLTNRMDKINCLREDLETELEELKDDLETANNDLKEHIYQVSIGHFDMNEQMAKEITKELEYMVEQREDEIWDKSKEIQDHDSEYSDELSEIQSILNDITRHDSLFSESELQDYIQETVEIPDNLVVYIDWEKLFADYMVDYTIITYQGQEYYIV